MRFELYGSVVISFRLNGQDEDQALTFAADEFSGIDTNNGFTDEEELVYRGIWAASEENILVRLTIVATRNGFREKHWEIAPYGQHLIQPHIGEDLITFRFHDEHHR